MASAHGSSIRSHVTTFLAGFLALALVVGAAPAAAQQAETGAGAGVSRQIDQGQKIVMATHSFNVFIGPNRRVAVNLVSYVWFAAMYRQSPVGLKALVDANDPASAARELRLQQIGWNAVVAEPMSGVTGMAESFTAAAQPAQETTMTTAERAEVIELLQKSEQELEKAIAGLTDAQWNFKPGPDRWSVGEVVEHIVLADALLFETAITSLDSAANAKWEGTLGKTNMIRKALPDRSRKVDAPAAIRPQQAMTRAAVMARFKEQRSKALAYVRDTNKPLKAHTAPNPFFGDLNAHQWLLYIPLHHIRHNQQIAEVQASPGYPR